MVLIFTKEVEEVMRILIVDDVAPIAEEAARFLRESLSGNNEVLKAFSGAEAIKILEPNPADIVVTDQTMPGMNGDGLTAWIKGRSKTAVVLWSSNNAPLGHKADLFLYKGDTDSLLRFIEKMQKLKKNGAT